ncbi:hypothetical protein [Archangium lipolyticum]|uniref:hypothetical protein n=1 Tax=Archangium lipolyticum TaxID=2970465 RepID=UPI00214A5371|nr:hypothetical protein [Archangium lipolyticum]
MAPSSEQLLSVARNYWPSSNEHYLEGEASPEIERLRERWEQELKKIDRWWSFLKELESELPEFTIGDATATVNASFRCIAYSGKDVPKRFAVVGCVSILAPVCTVYGLEFEDFEGTRTVHRIWFDPLPAEMQSPARVISRKLETTFGVSALPREIADIPVPLFVEWKEPPDTTLFHALFSSKPERVP